MWAARKEKRADTISPTRANANRLVQKHAVVRGFWAFGTFAVF